MADDRATSNPNHAAIERQLLNGADYFRQYTDYHHTVRPPGGLRVKRLPHVVDHKHLLDNVFTWRTHCVKTKDTALSQTLGRQSRRQVAINSS